MVIFEKQYRLTFFTLTRDLLSFLSLYIAGLIFLPKGVLLHLLNCVSITTCTTVIWMYYPGIREHFRLRRMGVALIRLGIVLTWGNALIVALMRTYWQLFSSADRSSAVFNSTGGVVAFVLILGAVLHIVAIGADEEKLSHASLRNGMFALASGIILGLVIIWFDGYFTPLSL